MSIKHGWVRPQEMVQASQPVVVFFINVSIAILCGLGT